MPRYTSQGIVYSLLMARSAENDLDNIGQTDPDTADEIYALLQEIKADQRLLEGLSVKDFGAARNVAIHVDSWVAQQQKGRNLWRFKSWDLEEIGVQYRVVYAFDPRLRRYFILAVLPRSFDYDEKHLRCQQLIAAYEKLNIPSYR